MKYLWYRMTHIGLTGRNIDPSERKRIVILNTLGWVVLVTIPFGPLFIYTGMVPPGHPINLQTQYVMLALIPILFVLHLRGLFQLARYLTILFPTPYVMLTALGLGQQVGFQYFLVLTFIVPFFVFSAKDKMALVIAFVWNMIGYLALNWVFEYHPLVTDIEPVGLARMYYFAMTFLIVVITWCVFALFQATNKAEADVDEERKKSEKLLLNTLPEEIVAELQQHGSVKPTHFDNVSVLFTDFQGFTKVAESMTPDELVTELDQCFTQFDNLVQRQNLEKLKTIGDSYMCAGGIPVANNTHAVDSVMAAIEIRRFMKQLQQLREQRRLPYWQLRIGIHSGPLVAGVIGENKFAYDVWGDTVNTASRMESSGTSGEINISSTTYELVKDFFDCEHRGKVTAKGKGEVDMYFVNGIKGALAAGEVPNEEFKRLYATLSQG